MFDGDDAIDGFENILEILARALAMHMARRFDQLDRLLRVPDQQPRQGSHGFQQRAGGLDLGEKGHEKGDFFQTVSRVVRLAQQRQVDVWLV